MQQTSLTAWSRAQWIALLSLSFAVFMVTLDVTVVVVSLPRIQVELGVTLAQLQWVVTSYSLVFAAFLLSAGVLADRFGRRRTFFIGLTLFALASGAAGLAGSATVLNGARAVQGLGAALLMSSSGALLAQTFPGADRTRAFGVWGAVVGIGLAFGPLIGGLITRHIGWHWIFLINLPVAVAIFAGVLRNVDGRFDSVRRHLDWIGLVTFSGGLFGVVYALSTLHPGVAAADATVVAGVAGAVLLLAFALSQRMQAAPMIALELLRQKAFVGITIMPVLLSVSYWSLLVFLPQYFVQVRGLDAMGAGIALIPLTLPMLILPPLSARLALRMPRHVHFAVSLAINGVGAGLILLGLHEGNAVLVLGMTLSGIGAGLINAQMTNVAVSVVPPERAGMATGISGTMRQAGFVFAIAIHTLMIEQADRSSLLPAPDALTLGLGHVLLSSMAAAALGALVGLFWLRQRAAPASPVVIPALR